MKVSRKVTIFAACIASAAALAACGSSSSSSSSSGGGSSGSSATSGSTTASSGAAPSSAGITQATINYGLQYTGGKAGPANPKLAPFVVGFVNQQGSTPAYPEMTPGAQAAVDFINQKLGGMAGRPLQLDTCIIQTEEDGQKCAAQFLDNPKVMSVEYGLTVNGNAPFDNTVTGKLPIITSWPGGPADYTTPGVRLFDGGALATLSAMVQDVKRVGAKSVALISSPNPAGKFVSEQILKPEMEKLGVKVTIVFVSDTGTEPDYASALAASGASNSQVIMSIPASANVCVFLYDAMKQLGLSDKKVIATYYCYGDPIPAKTGGGPKGWDFFGPTQNTRIVTPEQQVYLNLMKTYTNGQYTYTGAPNAPMGDLLTLAKFVNSVGPNITKAQIVEKIRAFRGPAFMVDGSMTCDQNATFIGACGVESSGSTYNGSAYVSLGGFTVGTLGPQFPTKTSAARPLPIPIVPKQP